LAYFHGDSPLCNNAKFAQIEIGRIAKELSTEPAARLPYVALARDNSRRCEAARWGSRAAGSFESISAWRYSSNLRPNP
jgi:hypothetical protein